MNKLLTFGEQINGYEVPVLNEREVRASAGILFFLALIAFMNAWLVGDFRFTRVFVVAFLIDFSIRVFINPKYAPSLVLGRLMVRRQQPEYVGAPQKRFAWAIGWTLALAMLFLVVINRVIGPVNLIICATCLLLMFFESAFGICLGCKIYNLFSLRQAQLCPGGVCETRTALPVSRAQMAVTVLFLVGMVFIGRALLNDARDAEPQAAAAATPETAQPASDCTPPDWAVAMGHADKWKLHHNCK
ncbi:MAG: DUF4395 domain-containing protein [Gammaproteobacteria bacterium]|nr:DUF4395 domain-containing protein [Gammaproteobacteria bacterium]MBU2435964.1 DUF4395 domain-containing protein [Gammaproteobacteria bacterium]MBU2449254.1 DUF4395 domain-containing protein [Gammaproteobacteria bacterium]